MLGFFGFYFAPLFILRVSLFFRFEKGEKIMFDDVTGNGKGPRRIENIAVKLIRTRPAFLV